jgi:hypothetical protein
MPRKMHEIGETYTTPVSRRVFTCVAHVEHVRRDGRTVLVPLWQIACVQCHAPWRHMRYRPKLITCRTCLAGYRPTPATVAALAQRRLRWQQQTAADQLRASTGKGLRAADPQGSHAASPQGLRAAEQGPQKPTRRPRKPKPWTVPDEPNTAVSNPIAGLFTD